MVQNIAYSNLYVQFYTDVENSKQLYIRYFSVINVLVKFLRLFRTKIEYRCLRRNLRRPTQRWTPEPPSCCQQACCLLSVVCLLILCKEKDILNNKGELDIVSSPLRSKIYIPLRPVEPRIFTKGKWSTIWHLLRSKRNDSFGMGRQILEVISIK